MKECQIVEATPFHAEWVGTFARPEDEAELWASSHSTAAQAIERGMRMSTLCWSAEVDGEPICIGGVVPVSLLTGIGSPWLVATPGVEAYWRQFVRASKPVIAACSERYPWMLNCVDARNLKAIRWLSWLGFTIHDSKPHGVDGLPFHLFERKVCHV